MTKEQLALYKVEKRDIDIKAKIETRDMGGQRHIEGLIPFNVKSEDMGFTEMITETAFNKTLADGSTVFALLNHSSDKVLGSTRAGTLTLTKTDAGLLCDVTLPDTQYAKDLWEIVSRGDVTTMSFGFYPIKVDEAEDGTYLLREVRLIEVSFGVTFPAYSATSSKALMRSLEELQKENEELKRKVEELQAKQEHKEEPEPTADTAVAEQLLKDINDTIKL